MASLHMVYNHDSAARLLRDQGSLALDIPDNTGTLMRPGHTLKLILHRGTLAWHYTIDDRAPEFPATLQRAKANGLIGKTVAFEP